MKTILKTGILLAAAVVMIAACTTAPASTQKTGAVTITVPEGSTLSVRIRTQDGSAVRVQGADKTEIQGTDEVRELNEDKPMQLLKATGTTIVFTGDIRELDIKDNGTVENIDVSRCPDMEVLYCAGNNITQLQLSANKNLKRLQCYNNRLSGLDISQQTQLELLWCGINQLSVLDVSGCKKLTQLRCYMNAIETEAMDALLKSLPAATGNNTIVREARILAVGDKIKNGKPSAAALQQAKANGWAILDSGNTPIEP